MRNMTETKLIPDYPIETWLNEFAKMPDDSLLEQIITYCEQHEIDSKELGYVLAESDQFKRRLHIDCVKKHQMLDPLLTKTLDQCSDMDEW